MIGLHPEEVKADWRDVLRQMEGLLLASLRGSTMADGMPLQRPIAIGEVGLDYYWSREFEHEQLEAFEEQVKWSIQTRLPLMIHCRKAQNELVRILKHYEADLPGGVFHCFTGNEHEAEDLLQLDRFVLGIGGVLTFKKSHLPEVLPSVVPLSRIVLETDAPYMAPVPQRGKRNESANVAFVLKKIAECYTVSEEEVGRVTNENVHRVFDVSFDPRP
jgi:TatD DNase family protein